MTGNLGDRYQMGDTLGYGGMSEVHRGRDVRLGRDVAIKVLRSDLARDPTFQTRFRREAQNAASLNHPAIVSVYDTGEMIVSGGTVPYIVMEFVDGETLRDLVKREGALSSKRAMEITADICAALDYSHRHGIIHRDVKPANVMLTRSGAVKVMDFGIARAATDGQATVTATAAVIGTAQYLSPEQARGEVVDARSDVYAVGCVLYELLTGHPPFTGDSPVAVAYQHVREEPKPPSAIRPQVPRELDAIVLKALNKNPMNRYQSAADMRSDLVRALSGQPVHATPVMDDSDRTVLLGGAVPAAAPAGAMVAAPAPSILATEPEWEDPSARSRRVWGFVGIGILCLALLAGATYLTLKITGAPPPVASVIVPDVTGKTPDEATVILREKNLTVATPLKEASSSPEMKGLIVDQNPSDGTGVKQGDPVTLTVGLGVTQVVVQNVQGMDVEAATEALQKQDLKVVVEQEFSTTTPGRVIRQDPENPTEVPPGSTVTITVSQGAEMTELPKKKDLIGLSLEEAEAALTAAKLKFIPQTERSDKPLNQVLSLGGGYKPGQAVQVDTVIPLVISDNSLMKMPPLTNMRPDDVLGLLVNSDLGWTGTADFITERPDPVSNSALWGRVTSQLPKAGELVSKDTPIQISVGEEPKVAIPDLSGMTKKDAQKALSKAGWRGELTIVTEHGETPPKGKEGTVIPGSQSPASGDQILMTDPVTIHIYPDASPPPDENGNNGDGGDG